jgi:SAM-dependent methyltransferase
MTGDPFEPAEVTRARETEWSYRNDDLADRLCQLIRQYGPASRSLRGLDVGTQHASVPSMIASELGRISFEGIEPDLGAEERVESGILIRRASSDTLPFESRSFDVVLLTSVFEHLPPAIRPQSLREIARVLSDDGVLVGQIPNMNFPVEVHSRLPGPQFLPRKLADRYIRWLSPVPWRDRGADWYRVSPNTLRSEAAAAGFRERRVEPFNPPRAAIPTRFRPFYRVLRVVPLGYVFVFDRRSAS